MRSTEPFLKTSKGSNSYELPITYHDSRTTRRVVTHEVVRPTRTHQTVQVALQNTYCLSDGGEDTERLYWERYSIPRASPSDRLCIMIILISQPSREV
jgi:hypothetical protein